MLALSEHYIIFNHLLIHDNTIVLQSSSTNKFSFFQLTIRPNQQHGCSLAQLKTQAENNTLQHTTESLKYSNIKNSPKISVQNRTRTFI
jgi:hypothetical protein